MRRFTPFALAVLFPALAACSESKSRNEEPVAYVAMPEISVMVGLPAIFDARDSYDPDNAAPAFPHGVDGYEWSIADPFGDAVPLTLTSGGAVASFIPQFVGEHPGTLVVVDTDEVESDPLELLVTGEPIPDELVGLVVRLTWESDVREFDLHVTRDGAPYGDSFGDCHYANKIPDWGAPGDANDPEFMIDLSEGPGPEEIRIPQPQDAAFTVYAHYNDDEGLGTSSPAANLFVDGVPFASEVGSVTPGDVWIVGTVTFTGNEPAFVADGSTFPEPI